MYNLTLVHWFDVIAYRLTCNGLYISITSPFIWSSLVVSLSSLRSQTLCPGYLKLPSLSIILPDGITCVIACCHNQKSLRVCLSFGNIKVDHCSPTPHYFKSFMSRDFPEAPSTSDKNNTCWCRRNVLTLQILSFEYPTRLNYIIINLSPSLGWSRGILHISTVISNISTFPIYFWTILSWSSDHISCRTPGAADLKSPFPEWLVPAIDASWVPHMCYSRSASAVY